MTDKVKPFSDILFERCSEYRLQIEQLEKRLIVAKGACEFEAKRGDSYKAKLAEVQAEKKQKDMVIASLTEQLAGAVKEVVTVRKAWSEGEAREQAKRFIIEAKLTDARNAAANILSLNEEEVLADWWKPEMKATIKRLCAILGVEEE